MEAPRVQARAYSVRHSTWTELHIWDRVAAARGEDPGELLLRVAAYLGTEARQSGGRYILRGFWAAPDIVRALGNQ